MKAIYYQLLNVENDVSQDVLRRRYQVLARLHHPDKGGDPEKFHAIKEAYEFLSDPHRRALYDSGNGDLSFENYNTNDMPPISEADIEGFKTAYRFSVEEEEDVLESYVKCNGNFLKLSEFVMASDQNDLPRFMIMVDEAIKKGTIKKGIEDNAKHRTKVKKTKRKQEVPKESFSSLFAKIQLNRQKRQHEIIEKISEKFLNAPKNKILKS